MIKHLYPNVQYAHTIVYSSSHLQDLITNLASINNSYMQAPQSQWFYKLEGPKAVVHKHSKCTTKGLQVYSSTVHAYNCFRLYLQYNAVLLFVICKSFYNSLDKNSIIFIKIKDKIKAPWQQLVIFGVIFQMHWPKLS